MGQESRARMIRWFLKSGRNAVEMGDRQSAEVFAKELMRMEATDAEIARALAVLVKSGKATLRVAEKASLPPTGA